MQSLAAHLKRRNLNLLQQELSLPKIPQNVSKHGPQTSARSRKQKQAPKYVSQTSFSPQQQHIQDQIRMVLQRQSKDYMEFAKTPHLRNKNQSKKEKSLLPRIKNGIETAHREVQGYNRQDKLKPAVIAPRKSRSQNTKYDLDSIFRNQSEFIENYFADISSRVKR